MKEQIKDAVACFFAFGYAMLAVLLYVVIEAMFKPLEWLE